MKYYFNNYSFRIFVTLFIFLTFSSYANENISFSHNRFIENKGQYNDASILFAINNPNTTLYITTRGLTYLIYDNSNSQQLDSLSSFTAYRVDMDIENASIDKSNIIKSNTYDSSFQNYYLGKVGNIKDVRTYDKIIVKNIYKNIDWEIYFDESDNLKYNFIVHPEANINDITLKWKYIQEEDIHINNNAISISTPIGEITEGELKCFQEGKQIPAEIIKNKTTIKYDVNTYNSSKDLIIDPQIYWNTYWGEDTRITHISTDSQNNIYAVGYLTFLNLFFTPYGSIPTQANAGAYLQTAVTELQIGFVSKFTTDGALLWSTYFGGGNNYESSAIISSVVDNNDNLFVTGYIDNPNLPIVNTGGGVYSQNFGGGYYDAFIAKFNVSGSLVWSTNFGGSLDDDASQIACNSQNDIYIFGSSSSTNLPIQSSSGYNQNTYSGGQADSYLAKFTNTGGLQWCTYLGGSGLDNEADITIDNNDNVVVFGMTTSMDFPLVDYGGGAFYQNTWTGMLNSSFITKFDANNQMIWSTYFSGNSNNACTPFNIVCNSQNDIYISGFTSESSIPLQNSTGYFQPTLNQGLLDPCDPTSPPDIKSDLFIARFSSQQVLNWSTYDGTGGSTGFITEEGSSMEIDGFDNLIILAAEDCEITSNNFGPSCWFVQQVQNPAWRHSKLLMFNKYNEKIWSTYYSTPNSTTGGGAITVDNNNDFIFSTINVIADGNFSINGPLNSYQQTNPFTAGGLETNLITKMLNYYFEPSTALIDTSICDSGSVSITASGNGATYLWQPNGESSQSIAVDTSGQYIVEMTFDNSCVYTDTFNVNINCVFELYLQDTTICQGECIDLIVNSTVNPDNLIFVWDNNILSTNDTITICPNTTTTYTVTSTIPNGDTYTVSSVVTVVPYPVVNLGNDTTICSAPLTLNANNNNLNYLWQDGSTNQTYNVTTSGTYYVTVSNGGCSSSDTINININAPILNLGNDTTSCTPNFILDAQNTGATYTWQDGSTNQFYSVTDTGTYYVTVVDNNGCSVSDTLIVSPLNISFSLGNDTIVCNDATLTLSIPINNANYLWSNNSTTQNININQNGTYVGTVTVGVCQYSDSINVNFEHPIAVFSVSDTIDCAPISVNFTDLTNTLSPITNWLWDFGDGQTSIVQNPTHAYEQSGVYVINLEVTTQTGCVSDTNKSVTIQIYDNPLTDFTFTPVNPQENEEVVFQNLSENSTSWLWDFGDGQQSTVENPIHFYNNFGAYSVTLIVNNHDCIDSISKTIQLYEELIFYVPNSFTPDGDAHNNTFKPVFTSGFDIYDYHLIIYNRWGEIIFESYNSEYGWNGTYANGGIVQDGVYIWQIKFGDINNDKKYIEMGHVTLLK